MRLTKYRVTYRMEGDDFVDCYDTFTQLMDAVSKLYAFDDYYTLEDVVIYADDRPIEYCGWAPDNRMVFKNALTGKIVWDREYPEYDH